MPVVIQQPSPMSPQTSINAGRAEVMVKDNPTLASLYEAAMRNDTQAAIATAQLGLRASETTAQLAQQARAHDSAAAMQEYQMQLARQVSPRDAFLADQQMQHQMLQMQAQSFGLSQREQMNMERMQTALADVANNPDLSDEEKRTMTTMIRTGLDPLQIRAKNAQMEQLQAQKQQAMDMAAQGMSIEQINGVARAKAFESSIIPATDQHPAGYLTHSGEFKPFDRVPTKDPDTLSVQDYTKIHHELYNEGYALYGKDAVQHQDKVDEYVNGRLAAMGLPSSVPEFVAQQRAQRPQRRPTPPSSPGQNQPLPTAPVMPVSKAIVAEAAPTPAAREELQNTTANEAGPFPIKEWRTQANPAQAFIMEKLAMMRARNPARTEDERALVQSVDFLANIMANFGRLDSDKMTEEQQRNVKAAMDRLRRSQTATGETETDTSQHDYGAAFGAAGF